MKTVFEKIIDGELPAEKIYEDDRTIVIKDIAPQARIHLLFISKKKITSFQAIDEEDGPYLLELLTLVRKIARQYGIEESYRLVTNNGRESGQTIFHLHFHLIGGSSLGPMA